MIKLYPTPEARMLILTAYEQEQETRRKRGLLRESLSQWCLARILAEEGGTYAAAQGQQRDVASYQ